MIARVRCLLLLPMMWLFSCNEEETSREEARVQKEVNQRVEIIRSELKVSQDRWRTVRIVTFSLLAGGSLLWLLNSHEEPVGNPRLRDGNPQPRRRVIDRPYEEDDESESYPYRR